MPGNVALTLQPNLKSALDRYSVRTGIPRSVIIARALTALLNNTPSELPKAQPGDGVTTARTPRRKGLGVDRG